MLKENFSSSLENIFTLAFLVNSILLLFVSLINLSLSDLIFPLIGDIADDCSTEALAAPPIWKVLIVS